MTRVGWSFLVAMLLVGGLFASMLSFGPAAPGIAPGAPAGPVPGPAGREPAGREPAGAGRLLVPVAGQPRAAIGDSWGDERGGGTRAHTGTDIAAPHGTPVVAAAAGTVERLFLSRDGGNTIYIRSPDREWSYYYAHLAGYAPDLAEGQAIRAGQTIGYVGDTGNAGAGNAHLHFGISRMAPGDNWSGGAAINPYPLLARGDLPR